MHADPPRLRHRGGHAEIADQVQFFLRSLFGFVEAPIGSFHVGISNEKSPEGNRGLTSRRRQAVHHFKKQHVLIFLALSALCINGYIEVNIHLEISVAASLIGLVIYRR